MPTSFQNRPVRSLLGSTPVLSVTATGAGISILGDDDQRTRRFVGYARETPRDYANSLEARIAEHRQTRASVTGPDAPLQLNPVQHSMYRRVMYGLREYTDAQKHGMSPYELAKVVRDHKKCDQVLHRLKVDTLYGGVNRIFNAIWPALAIGTKTSDYMVKLPADATLNKLKIDTRQIVDTLMAQHLLPANFLSLSGLDLDLR